MMVDADYFKRYKESHREYYAMKQKEYIERKKAKQPKKERTYTWKNPAVKNRKYTKYPEDLSDLIPITK